MYVDCVPFRSRNVCCCVQRCLYRPNKWHSGDSCSEGQCTIRTLGRLCLRDSMFSCSLHSCLSPSPSPLLLSFSSFLSLVSSNSPSLFLYGGFFPDFLSSILQVIQIDGVRNHWEQVVREISVFAHLHHPNILEIIGVGESIVTTSSFPLPLLWFSCFLLLVLAGSLHALSSFLRLVLIHRHPCSGVRSQRCWSDTATDDQWRLRIVAATPR